MTFGAGAEKLLPVIVQDFNTGRVLMMAWMSGLAYDETMRTGQAVFFSRSRATLWRKGEASGHVQRVHRVELDSDADTILLQVTQTGVACDEGYESSFYRQVNAQGQVSVTDLRLVDPADRV